MCLVVTELPASHRSCVGGSASKHTCFRGEAAAAAAATAAACSASSSASLATCKHAQLLMQLCFTNRCLLMSICNHQDRKQHSFVKSSGLMLHLSQKVTALTSSLHSMLWPHPNGEIKSKLLHVALAQAQKHAFFPSMHLHMALSINTDTDTHTAKHKYINTA